MQVMNFTWSAWLLLILAMIGHSHQLSISPTCASSDPCTTLTQYALGNTHSDSTRLVLQPGRHKLTTDLVVTNVFNFSVAAIANNQAIVDCREVATMLFENISHLVVENIAFVSCGKTFPQTTPGVTMLGVRGLSFYNISLSDSISGALYVANSIDLVFHNLIVKNNHESKSSIVHLIKCEANFTGTTAVFNNSISSKSMATEVVMFLCEDCHLLFNSIVVSDNNGPSGVVAVHGHSIMGEGDWIFQRNQVCNSGSLFLGSLFTNISGNMFFTSNRVAVEKECSGAAGIRIINSYFNITGDINFKTSRGLVTSMNSTNSIIAVYGSMNVVWNTDGNRAVTLQDNTILYISDALNANNNLLTHQVLRILTESILIVEKKVYITWNILSAPFLFINGLVILKGMVNFTGNAGVLFAFESSIHIDGVSNFTNNSFDDDYIEGTLALYRSTLVLNGSYSFEGNQITTKKGGAIYAAEGGRVYLSGDGKFINNSAQYGGAIYLVQRSQIYLRRGTTLLFDRNKAIIKGGAIYAYQPYSYLNCTSPPCFFQFVDSNSTATDTSITFTGNMANPGGSVLHVDIERLDYTAENHTFPAIDNLDQTFVIPDDSNTKPKYYSDTYRFCFCKNDNESVCDLNRRSKDLSVVRGRQFSVMVLSLTVYGDLVERPVSTRLGTSLREPRDFCFSPAITQTSNETCTALDFTVCSVDNKETLILNVGDSSIDENKTLRVNLVFEQSCPLGFTFFKEGGKCNCDLSIVDYIDKCEIRNETFQRRSNSPHFWIGKYYDNSSSYLFYKRCPRGYCITGDKFSFMTEKICTNNRTGWLCGECINGSSLLLGGVKCGNCSDKNSYLALLIVFAAFGILLVAFIFMSQMTVALGTFNGLIIYVNAVDVNRNIFLTPDFFKGFTIFISWLNLHFGFETCFYDGLDQIQYAAWQFVFPVYLWLMVGVIIVMCHYSMKISSFFGSSDPVAVLATVILLTYNSLVQNIIGIFSVAHLKLVDSNNVEDIAVWLYNGEVMYAKSTHIVFIAIAAIFVAFFFIPFTVVLTSAQFLQKYGHTSRMLQRLRLTPFINSYHIPFKPAHRYWVGLSLMMRAVVLLVVATAENEEGILITIITFCVVSLTMFGVTKGVYEEYWLNLLEISFLLNLAVLSASRLYSTGSSDVSVIAYISVTVAFITFLGIVSFHFYQRLKKLDKIKKAIEVLKNKFRKENKEPNKDNKSPIEIKNTTKHITDLREPLLESTVL